MKWFRKFIAKTEHAGSDTIQVKPSQNEIIKEIKRLADENQVSVIIFPNGAEMALFVQDMRLGMQIRYGMK